MDPLERLANQVDQIRTKDMPEFKLEVERGFGAIRTDIAALKARAGVWGTIGGLVASGAIGLAVRLVSA